MAAKSKGTSQRRDVLGMAILLKGEAKAACGGPETALCKTVRHPRGCGPGEDCLSTKGLVQTLTKLHPSIAAMGESVRRHVCGLLDVDGCEIVSRRMTPETARTAHRETVTLVLK
jgi:hypothetical protein